jgi:predicted nucleotidyltransferase
MMKMYLAGQAYEINPPAALVRQAEELASEYDAEGNAEMAAKVRALKDTSIDDIAYEGELKRIKVARARRLEIEK